MLKHIILILLSSCTMLFTTNIVYAAQNIPSSNKEIATEFFEAVVNKKDFNTAAKYLGHWYTEHDPEGMDGPQGLKNYIQFLNDNFPNSHVEIKRTIAEGEYVIFHVHSILTPGTKGQAIVDIFKLENGKVIEHWDVTQEIPLESANTNGMF